MKRRFSPKLLAFAGLALFCNLSSAHADNILWNTSGSRAWIGVGNWLGGVVPWSGDVAQFGVVGPAYIELTLGNPSYEPRHEARVGAVVLLADRTKNLPIYGASNSGSTFYLEGANLHGIEDTILVNEGSYQLAIAPASKRSDGSDYLGSMGIALRANEDHVVQVRGSGDVVLQSRIAGNGSQLSIRGTGSGSVILEGADSTYSGGTVLHSGTLIVAANGAAGTGAITHHDGTLQVNAGVTSSNAVILASQTADYQRLYNAEQGYGGFSATSDLGANDVTFSFLGGVAGDARTLSARFELTSLALNDAIRQSDILQLDGTTADLFVLELQLSEGGVNSGSFLAWLDGDQWVNATEGNSATGGQALLGFAGSFDASGATASLDYLGSWGYDAANGSVWAVVDHQGAFAVAAIPEPTFYALLGLGGVVLLLRRRRTS